MKKALQLLTLSLFLVLSTSVAWACSITQTGTTNGYYVNSEVSFTTSSAQAYYWSVSGPATIVGSKTSQNFKIKITGTGNITVNVTRFVNGSCVNCGSFSFTGTTPCSYSIVEYIPMTYSASCNCLTKRGDYSLKCGSSTVSADWEITPNGNNGSCIYWGCSTPASSRATNTTTIKPIPMCNWVGLNVTIKAYAPGTNTLLASKIVTIQSCGFEDDFPIKREGFQLNLDKNQLEINNSSITPYDIEVYDVLSGKKVKTLNDQKVEQGQYSYNLAKVLTKNQLYMIVIKDQEGNVITRKKIKIAE